MFGLPDRTNYVLPTQAHKHALIEPTISVTIPQMEDPTQSYRDAVQTGRSDGSVSGNRGQQEHYRRNAAVAHEANKLGETIWKGIFALFVHPVFCFVGFWILGLVLLLMLGPVIGVTESTNDDPGWYLAVAGGVPIVLAVLLRKHVRRIMIGVLVATVLFLAVKMYFEVEEIRAVRAGRSAATAAPATTAPPVAAPATRTLTPAQVQRALIDARTPETRGTPPAGATGSELDRIYCSGPPAERPAGLCN